MPAALDKDIIIAVIIATIVFFVLVAFSVSYFLIYSRRRKAHQEELIQSKKNFEAQLMQSRMEVQEQTFTDIAKELHDNVGQLLSTAKMLLGLTERGLPTIPDTLSTANATLATAIIELRSLSKSLDKNWLEQFSFSDNLKAETDRINTGRVISATVRTSTEINLPPDEQIILFRIVQEGIQNAIKHGQPTNITIDIHSELHALKINIIDNGSGFWINNGRGQGQTNMAYRAAVLGGSVTWESVPGAGSTVHITIPIKHTNYEDDSRTR